MKFYAFLICMAIQYIGVIPSGVKPVIAPTFLQISGGRFPCDPRKKSQPAESCQDAGLRGGLEITGTYMAFMG